MIFDKETVRKCANSAVDPELPSSNAIKLNTWMPRYGFNTKIDQAQSKLIRGNFLCLCWKIKTIYGV